jgi:protoporphyrinogen oxidase
MQKTIILGAGLSGVSLAYFARKTSPIIFEKTGVSGGRVESITDNNHSIETGAQFFSIDEPSLVALLNEIKLDSQLSPLKLDPFSVLHEGKLIAFKNKQFSKDFSEESKELKQFYEVTDELLSRAYAEEDFPKELIQKDFVSWYKNSVGDKALWLLESVIYAITFSRASKQSALYGLTVCETFFQTCYTLNNGMKTLISKLLQESKAQLKTDAKATKIVIDDGKAVSLSINEKGKIQEIKTSNQNIASGLPAPEILKIISDGKLRKELGKIEYNGCAVHVFETPKQMLGKDAGILVTDAGLKPSVIMNEPNYFNFSSNKGIIGVLVPYKDRNDYSKEDVLLALDLIVPNIGKKLKEIKTSYWDYGLPVHNYGLVKVQEKLAKMEYDNFHFVGDYLGLPSLDACVESAKKASIKIMHGK